MGGKQLTGLETTRRKRIRGQKARREREREDTAKAKYAETQRWQFIWPHGAAVAWLGDVCNAIMLPPCVTVALRMSDVARSRPYISRVWDADTVSFRELVDEPISVHGIDTELLDRAHRMLEPFRNDERGMYTTMLCPPPGDANSWITRDLDLAWRRIVRRNCVPDAMVSICRRMERYGLHVKPQRVKYETLEQYMHERKRRYGSGRIEE